MFKPVFPPEGKEITIYLEDEPVKVQEGVSVTAAVLEAGMQVARITDKNHDLRGPFCLMGVCHECLMEIDSIPNQQCCLIPVREGMRIKKQNGAPFFGPQEKS